MSCITRKQNKSQPLAHGTEMVMYGNSFQKIPLPPRALPLFRSVYAVCAEHHDAHPSRPLSARIKYPKTHHHRNLNLMPTLSPG